MTTPRRCYAIESERMNDKKNGSWEQLWGPRSDPPTECDEHAWDRLREFQKRTPHLKSWVTYFPMREMVPEPGSLEPPVLRLVKGG